MNAVPDAAARAAGSVDASLRPAAARPPRMATLEVFEAAARLGNFGAAAAELNLTPSAISKHVKVLERDVGLPLFARGPRGASLTPAGQRLYAAASEALRLLSAAASDLRGDGARGVVRVSVAPRFGERWLRPLLPRFRALHQQIGVTLVAEARRLDRRRGGFDIAVRYAPGGFPPGLEAVPWIRDELVPVAAPALLRGRKRTLDGLVGLPWLHGVADADWRAWLSAAGQSGPPSRTGTTFGDYDLSVAAAVAGSGVLIGRTAMIEAELRDGRLVEAVPMRVPSPCAYCLVRPIIDRGAAASSLWTWLLRHENASR